MAKSNTHLHFGGNCLEALHFYEKCLNGKIAFKMTWSEAPMAEIPQGWGPKICHASLEFGSQVITADDAPPARYEKPQGFAIMVNYLEIKEAEGVFQKLAEGGQTHMPFAKTFWAKGFGMCVDRFGISWMINCGDEK